MCWFVHVSVILVEMECFCVLWSFVYGCKNLEMEFQKHPEKSFIPRKNSASSLVGLLAHYD